MTTFPTVNINGSSAQGLLDQLLRALDAADDLKWALLNAAPHGRDYPSGREVWGAADAAHRRRLAMVEEIKNELNELGANLVQQRDLWEKR